MTKKLSKHYRHSLILLFAIQLVFSCSKNRLVYYTPQPLNVSDNIVPKQVLLQSKVKVPVNKIFKSQNHTSPNLVLKPLKVYKTEIKGVTKANQINIDKHTWFKNNSKPSGYYATKYLAIYIALGIILFAFLWLLITGALRSEGCLNGFIVFSIFGSVIIYYVANFIIELFGF